MSPSGAHEIAAPDFETKTGTETQKAVATAGTETEAESAILPTGVATTGAPAVTTIDITNPGTASAIILAPAHRAVVLSPTPHHPRSKRTKNPPAHYLTKTPLSQ